MLNVSGGTDTARPDEVSSASSVGQGAPLVTGGRDQLHKVGLFDLVITLLERKNLFFGSMLFFSLLGITVSLVSTSYYTAKAVVLPPKSNFSSPFGSLMGDLPISGLLKNFDMFGGNNTDQFLSILESRRIALEVIDSLKLRPYLVRPSTKPIAEEDVIKAFRRLVKISEDDYGNLLIAVTDTSPKVASSIANTIVRELDRINYELSMESARNSRLFFEDRLSVIKGDLDSASRKLADFQVEHNYIDLEQQAKSSIEAIARLEAEKMAIELQIQQLSTKFGNSNQRVRELEQDRAAIESKVKTYVDNGSGNLIISLRKAPSLSILYADLIRGVKVQETLYRLAIQMYEQAKFTEANNTPSVQVLEWAPVPQKRSRPKRRVLCVLFFCAGFVVTSMTILGMLWYYVHRQHQTYAYSRIRRAMTLLSFRK